MHIYCWQRNWWHQTHQFRQKRRFPLQKLPGVPWANVWLCVSLVFGNLRHYFFTQKETKTSTRILLRSAIIKFLVQGCLVLNSFCFIKHKAAKLHLFFNDDKHFVDRYDSWFNSLFHQELKNVVWGPTHSESDLLTCPAIQGQQSPCINCFCSTPAETSSLQNLQ